MYVFHCAGLNGFSGPASDGAFSKMLASLCALCCALYSSILLPPTCCPAPRHVLLPSCPFIAVYSAVWQLVNLILSPVKD